MVVVHTIEVCLMTLFDDTSRSNVVQIILNFTREICLHNNILKIISGIE